MGLQDNIRSNKDARYDHRLHVFLLAARGKGCMQVAEDLGDSLETVLGIVSEALRRTPTDFGLPGNIWDGGT